MPSKKFKNMGVEHSTHDKLTKYAKEKNISASRLVSDLADKYLVDDEEFAVVILKIPARLRGDRDELHRWLATRAEAVANKLSR